MRKKLLSILIAIVLCFSLVGCEMFNLSLGGDSGQGSISGQVLATPTSKPTIEQIQSQEIVRQENVLLETMRKSIVEIYSITESASAGVGSGVIFACEQNQNQKYTVYIVTCHHVINAAYYSNIRDINGNVYPAGLIGSNPNGDIAVLWAEFDYMPNVVVFGKSSDLVVGEEIYAIGNPTGTLGGTVTKGIISSTMREMYVETSNQKLTLLQIDSAINTGSSGGGLFTMDGYYVGMPNSGYSGRDGLGFAIPSDIVLENVNQLISTCSPDNFGYIPGMGSVGLSISNDLQVIDLTDEGSYKASGVKVGDLIKSVEIDGKTYTPISGTDFLQYLSNKKLQAGDTYKLNIIRNGEEKQLTINVIQLIYVPPKPPQAQQNSQLVTEDDLKRGTQPFKTIISEINIEDINSVGFSREPNLILEKNRNSSVEVYSTVGSGSTAIGSGVIVGFKQNPNGDGGTAYVVTNHHVIEGAYSIKIKNLAEKEFKAGIIGADSSEDLALLWAEVDYLPEYAQIADSDDVKIGDEVYAIGNPLGTLGGTVTKGVISGTSRGILMGENFMTLMQTDAAVNNGNSGGGLFSIEGYLIGIVNGGMPSKDGVGFAIPSKVVLNAVNSFLDTYMDDEYGSFGYIKGKPNLGVTFADGILLNSQKHVVYVSDIKSEGSLYEAGLRVGDNIVALSYNGKVIDFSTTSDLLQALSVAQLQAGNTLTITFSRNGQNYQTEVKLAQYIYIPPAEA